MLDAETFALLVALSSSASVHRFGRGANIHAIALESEAIQDTGPPGNECRTQLQHIAGLEWVLYGSTICRLSKA